jgi:hypothetical protein
MDGKVTRRGMGLMLGSLGAASALGQTRKQGADIHQDVDFRTGDTAEIQPQPGAAFKLFGGRIEGRNVELAPDRRIVQAWRLASWQPAFDCEIRTDCTRLWNPYRVGPCGISRGPMGELERRLAGQILGAAAQVRRRLRRVLRHWAQRVSHRASYGRWRARSSDGPSVAAYGEEIGTAAICLRVRRIEAAARSSPRFGFAHFYKDRQALGAKRRLSAPGRNLWASILAHGLCDTAAVVALFVGWAT